MNKCVTHAVLLWALCMAGVAHASYPVYADGDLAPLGTPDGLINGADYLIASRIALGLINPTALEYSHGDLYPAGAPDGIINIQDLLLLQQRVLGLGTYRYIEVATVNNILIGGAGTGKPGYSLYVFDSDIGSPGSNCNNPCAGSWQPLLVVDGGASGTPDLGTIIRADGSVQATYDGRPLYFYAGDTSPGDTNGQGLGGVWWLADYYNGIEVLFDNLTVLEPALQVDTPTALITRFSDRARDRHAREDQFHIYDHYLSYYWEHRTAAVEIVDTIGKGGNTITFNVTTQWKLSPAEAELRFFYRGINTVAEYHNNGVMASVPGLDVPGQDARHYTRSVNFNPKTGAQLQVGDRLEFELSQFLQGVPNGRNNYYGTAILYIVGQGIVPWEAQGALQDSFPMPVEGWLGGNTTLPYQYSDEPDKHFMQMATNLSHINGQVFVLGRRVHHTDFGDGSHNEAVTNPDFTALANLLGTNYVNRSCVACHAKNGRALPPAAGQPLQTYVVKTGDASGHPDPFTGAVLQPQSTLGQSEGSVSIASWNTSNGLRSPNFSFSGATPANFSARIAPQLVGMGLLEAISEADIEARADPGDSDGDGISGRMRLVTDPETGQTRIGRFGWKAAQASVKHQVASALNTDVGVMTSILPSPDCGAQQSNCGPVGAELTDRHLDNLSAYISLLGVSARRNLNDPVALQGEVLFNSAGCTGCHTDTFQTSPYHPHAELRDQIIHPYTDLLLHDMGPGLAATLIEGNASGAEWRTAPLWNIGLTAGVSGGEAYLHDGRARDLNEAILWHGGEADNAQQAYVGMTQNEKNALIVFLKTL
ncbi:MAG: di-heme oxidoredictase family protein [Gammaproteobacteria bacterium]